MLLLHESFYSCSYLFSPTQIIGFQDIKREIHSRKAFSFDDLIRYLACFEDSTVLKKYGRFDLFIAPQNVY
jgi:hypothetical protein